MKKILFLLVFIPFYLTFSKVLALDLIPQIIIEVFKNAAIDKVNCIDNPQYYKCKKNENSKKTLKQKEATGCLQIYGHSKVAEEDQFDLVMDCFDFCKNETDSYKKNQCEYNWLFEKNL